MRKITILAALFVVALTLCTISCKKEKSTVPEYYEERCWKIKVTSIVEGQTDTWVIYMWGTKEEVDAYEAQKRSEAERYGETVSFVEEMATQYTNQDDCLIQNEVF